MGRLSIAILLVVVLLTSSIITGCARLFEGPAWEQCEQGNELYEQGRLNEAIDEYTEAIEVEPTWADPYFCRGTTYCHLGQTERGIEDLSEAIRLDPELAEAYCNRGFAYAEQGRKAEAIADFEKFISLFSEEGPWAWAWIEMAKQQIEELSR